VAGLHAGLIYNTWPDMNGRVLPEDPFHLSPLWKNFFENEGLASSTTASGLISLRVLPPGSLSRASS